MDQLVRSEASLNKPRKQRSDFHATRPISGATGRVGFGQNGKRPIANMGYRFAHRHRQCRSCVDRDWLLSWSAYRRTNSELPWSRDV